MNWWCRHTETAVAPSLLAADFAHLDRELASMERAGADLFHLDVMDGHFVPNLTFGPFIAAATRRATELVLDAHLMVTDPRSLVEPFARAGIDALTIHLEADGDVAATLAAIRAAGMRPGVSLRPGTELADVEPWLPQVELVLVMSVEPGFGGQAFMPQALERIEALQELRTGGAGDYAISVDGGIDAETGPRCLSAGADILVSGSYLFGAADRGQAIASLRHI